VGGLAQTSRGPLTRVQDIVIADTNQASLTHVTFTHDSWAQIHAALDRRDDGVQIVGWYHTHPGFGPFLSAHDLFIHENFFKGPLQVATVLDPVKRLFCVFGWRDGKVQRYEGCYLYAEASQQEGLQTLVDSLEYAQDRLAPRKGLLSRLGLK
jgi:proteasome lid subunit RPN8/RPN11